MRRIAVLVFLLGGLAFAGHGDAQVIDDSCPTGSQPQPNGSCVCVSPDPALNGVVVVDETGEFVGPVSDCEDSQPPCGEPGAPPECAILTCAEHFEVDCYETEPVVEPTPVVEAEPAFTG